MTLLPICPNDDKPIHDGAWICSACGDELRKALTQIRDFYSDLDLTITRQSVATPGATRREHGRFDTGEPTAGSSFREPPIPNESLMPFNDMASEAKWIIDNTVTTWARDVMERLDVDLPDALPPHLLGPVCADLLCRHAACRDVRRRSTTLPPSVAAASLLLDHVTWYRQRREAEEFHSEILWARSQLLNAIDSHRRLWFPIGQCPLEIDTEDGGRRRCTGTVRAWPTPAGMTLAEQVKTRRPSCSECGHEESVEWWQSHIIGHPEASPLVTITDLIGIIAFELHWTVTHDQVRQWKARQKIRAEGRDAKGRTLYRHRDVIAAIREDVAKAKTRAERVGA